MARGRMINKKICGSVKFQNLPDDTCRLLATWIIANLDVQGVFYGDPAMVRSAIFPRRSDITVDQVEEYLVALESSGLMWRYKAKGDTWQVWPGFLEEQIGIRIDRESPEFPSPPDAKPQTAGELPEDCRNNDGNYTAEEKLSEVKLSKENIHGDEKTSPSETEKPKRKPSPQNQTRKDLEQHFSELTGLPVPKTNTQKQRASAGTLWWGPIREMAELCEWNRERSMQLMDLTVAHLKKGGMTVSSPKSIVNTAKAVATDNVPGVKFSGNGNGTKQKIETRKIKDENTGLWVEQEVVIR